MTAPDTDFVACDECLDPAAPLAHEPEPDCRTCNGTGLMPAPSEADTTDGGWHVIGAYA